jgi:hypothetical protein
MCAVSMVGDFHGENFPKKWPAYFPDGYSPSQIGPFLTPPNKDIEAIKADIAAMRKEFEEIKELLKRAKLYDEANNEPSCEKEEKVALLKAIGAALGVDLADVFKEPT